MSSIGRITSSIISGNVENTFALANLNFDFTLVKLEAPQEYQGVRNALSKRRVDNAEDGPLHRTARKLGALFEQIIPPIQTLTKAYGIRASEISKSCSMNKTGTARFGPFESHAGFDGASLYAAATSGTSAVGLHLLACLLARAFSPSEATAIWVELVLERKRDIEVHSDDSQLQSLAARMACRQDISRDELAKWDASARAWLLSADEVKKFETAQFKLITKDFGMFASSVGGTYASIIDVWTTAMRSLQDLINGMPQSISKGALLLGISAWHIYPDLNVVGPTVHVKFKDPLVNPGGTITLGLAFSENDTGAKWSLSLSHLRYYGDPVKVSMSAETNISRITMGQLHLVALGSLIGTWETCVTSVENAARLFVALKDCLSSRYSLLDDFLWLDLICTAATKFLQCSPGTQKDEALSLVAYGRRRGKKFLYEEVQARDSIFGLADPSKLMWTKYDPYEDIDAENFVEDVRHLASRYGLRHDQCFIRYRRNSSQLSNSSPETDYECATAIPLAIKSRKRDQEGVEQTTLFHERWVGTSVSNHLQVGEECHHFDPRDIRSFDTFDISGKKAKLYAGLANESMAHFPNLLGSRCSHIVWRNTPYIFWNRWQTKRGTLLNDRLEPNLAEEEFRSWLFSKESNGKSVVFDLVFSTAKGGLYKIRDNSGCKLSFLKDFEVTQFLQSEVPKPEQILRFLCEGRDLWIMAREDHRGSPNRTRNIDMSVHGIALNDPQNFEFTHSRRNDVPGSVMNQFTDEKRLIIRSLNLLAQATIVYDQLSGATVSITVAKRPLHLAKWASSVILRVNKPEILNDRLDFMGNRFSGGFSRPAKFACIAMFETGTLDLDPSALSSVMAISSGNSIYVADGLIQDPLEHYLSNEHVTPGMTRILGNLGRPGVVMLVPPQEPRVLPEDPERWRLVNHHRFNNELIDSFTDTSLHLSFTEYEIPLSVPIGAMDAEAIMLESLISVYDRKRWIADLDILRSLADQQHSNFLRLRPCAHGDRAIMSLETLVTYSDPAITEIVSIDNWDELLDPPESLGKTQVGVIRACNNWHARLATMSVSVQKKHNTFVLPSHELCKYCLLNNHLFQGFNPHIIVI